MADQIYTYELKGGRTERGLITAIEENLSLVENMETQVTTDETGCTVLQARLRKGKWKQFIGMDRAITVRFNTKTAGEICMELGEAKWADKASGTMRESLSVGDKKTLYASGKSNGAWESFGYPYVVIVSQNSYSCEIEVKKYPGVTPIIVRYSYHKYVPVGKFFRVQREFIDYQTTVKGETLILRFCDNSLMSFQKVFFKIDQKNIQYIMKSENGENASLRNMPSSIGAFCRILCNKSSFVTALFSRRRGFYCKKLVAFRATPALSSYAKLNPSKQTT